MRRSSVPRSSSSKMVKLDCRPACSANSRSSRAQIEWNVPIQTRLARGPTSSSTRPRISAAALFVKVTASTCHGATSHSVSR